jgi:hypothetical protein
MIIKYRAGVWARSNQTLTENVRIISNDNGEIWWGENRDEGERKTLEWILKE